jgi:hypothetical protein
MQAVKSSPVGNCSKDSVAKRAASSASKPSSVGAAVQKRVGSYRPELAHTDDYEMWMRIACLGCAAEIQAVAGGSPEPSAE